MGHDLIFKYHTFGCKVNTYDTGLLQKNNLFDNNESSASSTTSDTPKASVHILNTCAVTGEATKQAVRLIRKIKSKEPLAKIVVTGCAAQVDTSVFEKIDSVDLIVANSHKHELNQILDKYFKRELTQKVFKGNIFRKEDLGIGGGQEKDHTRSFLKIQDGCNSFCSYCIIPFARGTSRSLDARILIARINELVARGVKEVVLTGVHIGDYEDPITKLSLEGLLDKILSDTKLERIRLTSLEPVEITSRLMELFKNPRMCPHFHMSIQSANTQVLKDMKRNYTQKEVIESLVKIKELLPNAFVGMDVIVGFPTETSEYFNDTLEVLKKLPWSRIHVFPYSERVGTKAEAMSLKVSVPLTERKHRAEILRRLSLERLNQESEKYLGTVKKVLVMKNNKGLTAEYLNVELFDNEKFFDHWVGKEIQVRLKEKVIHEARHDVTYLGELIHEN